MWYNSVEQPEARHCHCLGINQHKTARKQVSTINISEMGKTMHRELKRKRIASFNNLNLSDLCSENASLQACQSEREVDQTANTQDDDPTDVQIL